MSTSAQIAANQANAKLSTGPTSEAGRKIVSANSVKHGFCAKVHTLLPGEEEPFAQHLEGYIKTYAPVGAPEEDLVRSLADSNWRLTKITALERTLLIRLETVEPDAFEDTLKELRRTSTYGNRTQRAIEKTRAALKEMQSARRSAYDKAQQEAILLTQLAHAKGQPPDQSKEFPSPELCGGFVYALPEIARLIARAARWRRPKPSSKWRRPPGLRSKRHENPVPAVWRRPPSPTSLRSSGPQIFLNSITPACSRARSVSQASEMRPVQNRPPSRLRNLASAFPAS